MRAMQIYGHDKTGRPLIWLKADNYDPSKTSLENV